MYLLVLSLLRVSLLPLPISFFSLPAVCILRGLCKCGVCFKVPCVCLYGNLGPGFLTDRSRHARAILPLHTCDDVVVCSSTYRTYLCVSSMRGVCEESIGGGGRLFLPFLPHKLQSTTSHNSSCMNGQASVHRTPTPWRSSCWAWQPSWARSFSCLI